MAKAEDRCSVLAWGGHQNSPSLGLLENGERPASQHCWGLSEAVLSSPEGLKNEWLSGFSSGSVSSPWRGGGGAAARPCCLDSGWPPPMLARAVLARGHRRQAVPAEPACLCLGAGVVSAPLGQVTFGTVSPFLTRWEGASFHHSQVPVGQTLLRACAWQNC